MRGEIKMKQWSMPTVQKMGLERTKGYPGAGGRDTWMSEEEEEKFEKECGPTGSGPCDC